MPEPIDLYAILGLARDATQAQISTAYRTQLRRYHPDTRTPADTTRAATSDAALQHVLTAYTVLRDPARRFAYDQQTTPRSSPTPHNHLRSTRHGYACHAYACHGYAHSTIHPCEPDQSTGHREMLLPATRRPNQHVQDAARPAPVVRATRSPSLCSTPEFTTHHPRSRRGPGRRTGQRTSHPSEAGLAPVCRIPIGCGTMCNATRRLGKWGTLSR